MQDIKTCQKLEIEQGAFYLGESTEKKSVGYLELKPNTSLTLHNRLGGIENLTQVEGKCVMVVFATEKGENHLLEPTNKLSIKPEGVYHIHTNPYKEPSLTYWDFDGDIRHVIEDIRNNNH